MELSEVKRNGDKLGRPKTALRREVYLKGEYGKRQYSRRSWF